MKDKELRKLLGYERGINNFPFQRDIVQLNDIQSIRETLCSLQMSIDGVPLETLYRYRMCPERHTSGIKKRLSVLEEKIDLLFEYYGIEEKKIAEIPAKTIIVKKEKKG